jgi:DNA-binding transcriptional ArsR family regulator
MPDDLDAVWKALSDPTRRAILDLLRQGPLTTSDIVEAFPQLSRFGVMKHMEVLREASLIDSRSVSGGLPSVAAACARSSWSSHDSASAERRANSSSRASEPGRSIGASS